MIDLSLLTDGGVGWLDASGPSSHLVLSTRIRLARNLADHVFQGRTAETVASKTDGIVVDVTQFPGGIKGTEAGYIQLMDYLVNSVSRALAAKK